MLKLNVGFTKKVGDPNYGSRGAAVNLELELDSGLVGDAERLKERIRQLFALAKSSVDEELTGAATTVAGNGTSAANGTATSNGGTHGRRDNTRRATSSQVRALHAIADRRQLNLENLMTDRFGNPDPSTLSIVEASQLIDELKQVGNGVGGRR